MILSIAVPVYDAGDPCPFFIYQPQQPLRDQLTATENSPKIPTFTAVFTVYVSNLWQMLLYFACEILKKSGKVRGRMFRKAKIFSRM
jgi:hypothetical protein